MATPGELLVAEVERLFPEFLNEPIDREMSKGNAAILAIEPGGRTHGRIFGDDRAKSQWCFSIAQRKVMQVLRTGYATGDFESRVWTGKLDEETFGLNRPDFIGWEGGVPFENAQGELMAAAFSGFRGIKDVEILHRAIAGVSGWKVRSH
ncbi:MAG TPA: hypothetical protein VGL42_07160 [Opitutaceae bacterium]|jgi:glc operon protein GlcG